MKVREQIGSLMAGAAVVLCAAGVVGAAVAALPYMPWWAYALAASVVLSYVAATIMDL